MAPASANTIQLMDDISDGVSFLLAHPDTQVAMALLSMPRPLSAVQLCQVYDSAEFCRNVHADPEWQRQAVEAIMLTASKHSAQTSP